MQPDLVGVLVVLGLAVGSFLNVVIWRVPRRESVVRPGSACPACGESIAPRDNVPVVSWALLRGRCRSCRAGISVRYPLVELACAVLFGLVAWRVEDEWTLAPVAFLAATLLAISLIDLEHYIVPNRIVAPALGASLLLYAGALGGPAEPTDLVRAVTAGLVAGLGLGVVHLVSPGGMGMGDVKLAFLLGLHLGWAGWGQVGLGFFLGFAYGSVVGVGLLITGRRGRREHIPFAPFLAGGTMTALLWGAPIIDWYRGAGS